MSEEEEQAAELHPDYREPGVTNETKYILAEIQAWADAFKALGDAVDTLNARSVYVMGDALSDKIRELYEDLGINPHEDLR